jgi:hypothetical protein
MLSRRSTDVADENARGIVCWQASHQAKPGWNSEESLVREKPHLSNIRQDNGERAIKDMKLNGVKKDGNKKAFGLSNEDRYVSGIEAYLTSHLYISQNSASMLFVLHWASSSSEAITVPLESVR